MAKITLVLIMGLAVMLAFSSSASASNKVTICHASGLAGTTKYETLTIGWMAVYGPAGHFYENGTPRAGHEQDYLGACEISTSTPRPTSTFTPTATPMPTNTSEPTATPHPPTNTPRHTPTDKPDNTPTATNTPVATATSMPPVVTSITVVVPVAPPETGSGGLLQ